MRVFYHYEDLEEYHAGMWKIVRGKARKEHITNAADLMRQPCEFKNAMLLALKLWPKSCEANLTAEMVNRIAWLGHAGCCIKAGSPEECTRVAWHTLHEHEQQIANKMANEVLATWLKCRRVEEEQHDLFDWMAQ